MKTLFGHLVEQRRADPVTAGDFDKLDTLTASGDLCAS